MFPKNLVLIPITDKLPDDNQDVIGWNGVQLVAAKYVKERYVVDNDPTNIEYRGMFEIEKYVDKGDRSLTEFWVSITHWMPAKY